MTKEIFSNMGVVLYKAKYKGRKSNDRFHAVTLGSMLAWSQYYADKRITEVLVIIGIINGSVSY